MTSANVVIVNCWICIVSRKSSPIALSNWKRISKGLPINGLTVVNPDTGELETHFPPSESSTTSVAVTLKQAASQCSV
jgi:hypothetical protein